jgi:hypothetical protein
MKQTTRYTGNRQTRYADKWIFAQRNRYVEDKTFNTLLRIVWCITDGIDGRYSCIPGVNQAFLLNAHTSVVTL